MCGACLPHVAYSVTTVLYGFLPLLPCTRHTASSSATTCQLLTSSQCILPRFLMFYERILPCFPTSSLCILSCFTDTASERSVSTSCHALPTSCLHVLSCITDVLPPRTVTLPDSSLCIQRCFINVFSLHPAMLQ